MKVSVIIPTYNGAHKLPGILQALRNQSVSPFDIVVVIDGSTDETLQVLQELQLTIPSLRVVEQENKGRAAVRNTGMRVAQGELLIFFDDDMLPERDCIEKHVQHHEKHKGSVLTGGLREPFDDDSPEIVKYKAYLSNKWNAGLKTDNGRLDKSSIFITAANFSIYKRDMEYLGGFDERLNDAEDFDLAVRAFKAGLPLFFKHDVFAWHNDVFTTSQYIRRQRQYTVANEKLMSINPVLATDRFKTPVKKPVGWRRLLFRFFVGKVWIRAVDKNFFKYLPQNVKYKLYDLIITANGVYYPEKVTL